MKILLQSHGFPPHERGGTETYTAQLASELVARGHQVEVLAARKEISRPDLSWVVREERGYRVHELVNNLFHRSWESSYSHPRIEALYAAKLEQLKPDIVHLQHLLHWSAGCVAIAARKAAVFCTLHDYWLRCARHGQRRHRDGTLCETVDFERCGSCLVGFPYAQGDWQRRVGKALSGLRSASGLDLGPLSRRLAAKTKAPATAPLESDPELVAMARAREQHLRAALVGSVRRFFAPSQFLRQRFLEEWALDEQAVLHLPFGLDAAPFQAQARTLSERTRVGFLGSLIEAKGAHVLLEAWGLLDPQLRERAQLVLYGPRQHEPQYQARLDALAQAVGARLAGPIAREALPATLAALDGLVIPSLWWENAPLVVLEARAARLPVLATAGGALGELVEQARLGQLFPRGDAQALAALLERWIQAPEALRAARQAIVPPPTAQEHFDRVVECYAAG